MEWKINKTTKKCFVCQQVFQSEESFLSILLRDQQGAFLRQDYCAGCEDKKPDHTFFFWRSIIAKQDEAKASREVLISFFDNLVSGELPDDSLPANQETRNKVLYLFALILMRKKILKLKESITKDNIEMLVLERSPDGKRYEIPDLKIADDELISLREEFSRLFDFQI